MKEKYFNERQFNFEEIFDWDKDNDEIYFKFRDKLLDSVTSGMNYCLMTYGQTSSGKTYTLLGDEQKAGIVALFLKDVFKKLNDLKSFEECDVKFKYSYFEIYKEKIYDLLEED